MLGHAEWPIPRATASWPLGLEALTTRPAYQVPQDWPRQWPWTARDSPSPGVIQGHSGGDLHQCAPRWTNSHCLGPFKNGQTSQPLAYIHFEEKSGRLSPINQLTREEAWRIAVSIAKLPELLRKLDRQGETRGRKLKLQTAN